MSQHKGNRETMKSLNPKICQGKIVGNADPYEPTKKKPYYVPLYWLFNRDSYNGIFSKPYNKGVVQTPRVQPKQPGDFFHCSSLLWFGHDFPTASAIAGAAGVTAGVTAAVGATAGVGAAGGVATGAAAVGGLGKHQVKKKDIVPTVQENVSKFLRFFR